MIKHFQLSYKISIKTIICVSNLDENHCPISNFCSKKEKKIVIYAVKEMGRWPCNVLHKSYDFLSMFVDILSIFS